MKKSFLQKKWFKEQVSHHEKPLLRYCLALTGNKEQAQEIVQETFIKLWSEDFLKVQTHVAPWLYRVCRNSSIDYHRRRKKMDPFDESKNTEVEHIQMPEEEIEKNEIFGVINDFPPEQQEIFILKFQEGHTNIEISEITGMSVSNIGIIIFRGLKIIRDTLKIERVV